MKKFYMIAGVLLLGVAAQAQDLTFVDFEGKEIADGSTYYCNRTTEWRELKSGIRFAYDPGILIKGASTGTISVSVKCETALPTEVDPDFPEYTTELEFMSLCCGGNCQTNAKEITKEDVAITAGEDLKMEFEFKGKTKGKDILPTKNVKTVVTAQYAFAPASKKTFTVIFNSDNAAVEGIESESAIRIANGEIIYNVEKASAIAIYDLAGRKVIDANVDGAGSISTADLQNGVYVYSVKGGVNKSGKILVK